MAQNDVGRVGQGNNIGEDAYYEYSMNMPRPQGVPDQGEELGRVGITVIILTGLSDLPRTCKA